MTLIALPRIIAMYKSVAHDSEFRFGEVPGEVLGVLFECISQEERLVYKS